MANILRQKSTAPLLSKCEKNFVLTALKEGKRLDGRFLKEFRNLEIAFGTDYGCCFVSLGETKVITQIYCDIDEPRETRPNEGVIHVNLEFGPMANAGAEAGRQNYLSVHVNRFLEKCIKDSRCVDLEALCIVSEEKVWILRLCINVLNNDGNLLTCCSIAALSALAHFKTPLVTFEDEDVIVHSLSDKLPVPLSLHHYPIVISYAFFENGQIIISDPTDIEERISIADLAFGMNSYREICALHFGGEAVINKNTVLSLANEAASYAGDIVKMIKAEIEKDNQKRRETRGDIEGLLKIINTERVLSASQDRNSLRLPGSNIAGIASGLGKVDLGESDDSEEGDSGEEEDELGEEEEEEENGDEEEDQDELDNHAPGTSTKLGQGEVKFGEEWMPSGGSSKWTDKPLGEGDGNDDSDDDEVEVIGTITDADRIVDNIVLSGDSEEEETTTLEGKELQKS